jgi:hypothetical protein
VTVGQTWRRKRDLAIFAAHRGGCSQRLLAEVHDLPRSRIATICRTMAALGDAWKEISGHPDPDRTPGPLDPFPSRRRRNRAHARG